MPLPTALHVHRTTTARLTAAAVLLLGATLAGTAGPAQATDINPLSLAGVTGTGIHNTYDDESTYTYLANALDTGTSLVELDTWSNVLNGGEVLPRG